MTMRDEKQQTHDWNIANKNEKKKNEKQVFPKLAMNRQLTCIREDSASEHATVISSVKSSEVLVVPPVNSMKQDLSKGISSSSFNERMLSMMRMKAHFVCVEYD